jgi:4-hydroxy-4-methyl-2-oxoglutarate aldolase
MEISSDWKALYTGVISDTLRYDFNYLRPTLLSVSIKPMIPQNGILIGKAFTSLGANVNKMEEINDSIRLKMYDSLERNTILVISSGAGRKDVAQFGDISALLAQKSGVAGVVMDGLTRDLDILKSIGLPIFASGATPRDGYGLWQIVDYQVEISMPGIDGDVVVMPGDLIAGDSDGVIVIPASLADNVLAKAYDRLDNENRIRSSVLDLKNKKSTADLDKEIARW